MRLHSAKGMNSVKRFAAVWLLGILLCLGMGQSAGAAVRYVRTDGSDSNSGDSWGQAFQTIQKAIQSAASWNDEIWVKKGTYQPSSYILVDRIVGIYGGFDGSETDRGQRDWRKNVTTVDGREVIYHCFYIDWAMDGVVIDGFTITGGNANGPDDPNPYRIHGSGGGIFNHQAASTIANCTFVNNKATQYAGGGGAIYVHSVNAPTIVNCAFYNNEAVGSGGTHGGAIHSNSSNPKVTNCVFSGNKADGYGGALLVNGGAWNGQAAITNCTFYRNNLGQSPAIYTANSAHPTITNSILWGDPAAQALQIWADRDWSLAVVSYSDIQGGPTGNWFTSGSSIIDQDPLFLDPANGNFHLAPSSPCLDAGDNAAVPAGVTTDFDGHSRIVNSVVDMGADEFKGVWYVDQALAQSGNGMFWSTAFKTIQEAVDAARGGHEIWVKQGLYAVTSAITVDKAVRIYGGFSGMEILMEERVWKVHKTTVTGSGAAQHCFYVTQNAVIDGLVITGGNATGADVGSRGGGLYVSASNATISNCLVQGNSAADQGGGLFNAGSGNIINCVFWDNHSNSGGGIANSASSSPQIVNCTLFGNSATTSGGAVFNNEASPAIINSILWGNTGGEIYNAGASLSTVTYCDIDQDGYSGNGNIRQDPRFLDSANGDFRLRTDSPCIDVGTDGAVPAGVTLDFEGDSRNLDGDGNDISTVDMGADEYKHIPATWHVDGTRAASGDGRTWAAAFKTMEEALANSSLRDYDEIWVKSGTYRPPETAATGWNNGEGLLVNRAIKIFGGFPSSLSSPTWSDRDWKTNETVIDANGMGQWGASYKNRCFFIDSEASTFLEVKVGYPVIDGFTLTGGRHFYGGGMYIQRRSPMIANCVIKGNEAPEPGFGGGIYAASDICALTVVNCLISGNKAPTGSAMVLMTPGWADYHAKVINCTVAGNTTTGSSLGTGTFWIRRAYDPVIGAEFVNSILWGNSGPSGSEELYFWNDLGWTPAGASSVNHCDIQGASSQPWFDNGTNGTGNIDQDPLFVNAGAGDYLLPPLSPCVDTGDDAGVPVDLGDLDRDGNTTEPLPFDLGGGPRSSGTVDMGAYEMSDLLLLGDVDGNQAVNMADAILALRILAGMNSGITVNMGADVNGDGRIGFAEALYVIQFEAGLRIP